MKLSSHNALIKMTKIMQESTSITALYETHLSRSREEQDCSSVQSCASGRSSMGNGIPQDSTRNIVETFSINTEIQCILKIQVSRFGEMLTFCHTIN